MSIYTLHHQVRRLDETLCDNGRKYSTENVLFSGRGKRILLGKLIAEGGEGSVFSAHPASESPLVAKLYHPAQRMHWGKQKIRLMCSRPIRSPAARDPVRRTETLCRRADAPSERCSSRGFCISCGAAEKTISILEPLLFDQAMPEFSGIRPCCDQA